MKAFAVRNVIWPGPQVVAIYSGETAGKAKALAAKTLEDVGVPGSAWKGLRCRRAPEFDGPDFRGVDEAQAAERKRMYDLELIGGAS